MMNLTDYELIKPDLKGFLLSNQNLKKNMVRWLVVEGEEGTRKKRYLHSRQT